MMGRMIFSAFGGSHSLRDEDRLTVAVAALLVELARVNDGTDTRKRAVIRRLLCARFGIDDAKAETLLAAAERSEAEATGVYGFVKEVVDGMTPDERIGLVEMMWEVVFTDGGLDPDQDALVRRIAGLIYVGDRDRGEARHRVLARLGRAPLG